MKLPVLETQLKDITNFKDFYHFTFNYAKNPSQKGLDLDMAITYWNIVMRGRFKFLHLWCKFLEVSWRKLFSILESDCAYNTFICRSGTS